MSTSAHIQPEQPLSARVSFAESSSRHKDIEDWTQEPTSLEQSIAPDHELGTDQRYLESIRAIHNFTDEDVNLQQSLGSLPTPPTHKEPPLMIDLVDEMISSGEADSLLQQYRTMAHSFPFVPIPAGFTAQELLEVKPMLCLAVLTVASAKDHTRQMQLNGKYRFELSQRTIVRPKRTISLIQSALVYLSW